VTRPRGEPDFGLSFAPGTTRRLPARIASGGRVISLDLARQALINRHLHDREAGAELADREASSSAAIAGRLPSRSRASERSPRVSASRR
jgi:hypothetical protein